MLAVEYYTRTMELKKRVGKAEAPLIFKCIERNCFGNCLMNLKNMNALAGKSLKIVAGSLGLCDPPPVWFEFGGTGSETHTVVHQFTNPTTTDVHFWLEDEDGNVWDVVDEYLHATVAPFHRKRIDTSEFLEGSLINGISKERLKERGLAYIAADPSVSSMLVAIHLRKSAVRTLES